MKRIVLTSLLTILGVYILWLLLNSIIYSHNKARLMAHRFKISDPILYYAADDDHVKLQYPNATFEKYGLPCLDNEKYILSSCFTFWHDNLLYINSELNELCLITPSHKKYRIPVDTLLGSTILPGHLSAVPDGVLIDIMDVSLADEDRVLYVTYINMLTRQDIKLPNAKEARARETSENIAVITTQGKLEIHNRKTGIVQSVPVNCRHFDNWDYDPLNGMIAFINGGEIYLLDVSGKQHFHRWIGGGGDVTLHSDEKQVWVSAQNSSAYSYSHIYVFDYSGNYLGNIPTLERFIYSPMLRMNNNDMKNFNALKMMLSSL
jgi:hypothetical protein